MPGRLAHATIVALTLVAGASCVQQITEVVEVPADTSQGGGGGGEAEYQVPDPLNDCEVGCSNLIGCSDLPDCVAQCKAAERTGCETERETFEICLAREVRPGSCHPGLGCGDAANNWLSCVNVGFEGQCTTDEAGTCACEMADTEGHSYAMQCFGPATEDRKPCICIRDGEAIGRCLDSNPCDATRGCCTAIFFAGGLAP